jgi:uncharacterized protein (DUF1501 family)
VIASWPGLAQDKLCQGRDLAPTLDLRGPFKAALAAQFDIDEAASARTVFPDTASVKPREGLIRS